MKLQTVRGTRDIFGDEARLFNEIDQQFRVAAQLYDFQEMETPIFEFTPVFSRSLGDASDIVNKEMYTFEDRSGDSLTLRPEGTAAVARAVISNSMLRDLPLKLFYSGPMFRHERPQKGRYRQFRQFGIELIGVDSPIADIEVLACAWDFFKKCGLSDKVTLEINTLGDDSSRDNYRKQLVDYFSEHKQNLSEDSRTRLQGNPLRILDSKDEGDQKIVAGAPDFTDSLNTESKEFFTEVQEGLQQLQIPFSINSRLVRGLDYYNHTVFEFVTSHLGSQNAVLSGGRYNGLIESMGGPQTPGVGWAAGTDRLALLLEKPKAEHQTVAVLSATDFGKSKVLEVMQSLRDSGIPAQTIYSGNMSKQMKKANKRGCSHALILGDELQEKQYVLKNFTSGEQTNMGESEMLKVLKSHYE